MEQINNQPQAIKRTTYSILFLISFSHLINDLLQAGIPSVYPLLKENKHINFIGNIEGRDVLLDKADVMVCEGFTGNIILKLAESLYEISNQKKVESPYFERFNFENYGGTPVLGVAKPVIIGHGISGSKAFMNMIHLAQLMIEKKLMEKMKEELS